MKIEIELGERTVVTLLELAKALTRQAGASPEPSSYPQPAPASDRFRRMWDWTPERLARIDEMVQQNVKPKNIMRALCEMQGAIGSRAACVQKVHHARKRLHVHSVAA